MNITPYKQLATKLVEGDVGKASRSCLVNTCFIIGFRVPFRRELLHYKGGLATVLIECPLKPVVIFDTRESLAQPNMIRQFAAEIVVEATAR